MAAVDEIAEASMRLSPFSFKQLRPEEREEEAARSKSPWRRVDD